MAASSCPERVESDRQRGKARWRREGFRRGFGRHHKIMPFRPDAPATSGMVACVESYVGRRGGHEGIKLEERVAITETGSEVLSRYPLDERLSA